MENLVSTDWLSKHLDDPDLVILDCTNYAEFDASSQRYKTTSGCKNWVEEHIEHSVYADFTKGLAGNCRRFRNTLPEPEQFAVSMGELGVSDHSRVVLYDSGYSMWAARVWWMLRWVGFDNAAILNGGWQSWEAEGRRISSEPSTVKPGQLTIRLRPELFVTKDDIISALEDGSIRLIDALSEVQFSGESSELGLSGHIPTALNIPAASLVDPETAKYIPDALLRDRFLCENAKHTIIYCGSGIAAASNAFVMTRLGFKDLAIYMPGLQEWIEDADVPLARGHQLR